MPQSIQAQKAKAKSGCRKIYSHLRKKKVLVIDNETYVPRDPTNVPGNEYYHAVGK